MSHTPKSKPQPHPAPLPPLPPLPVQAKTRDGQVVDPRNDLWILRMRKDGGNFMFLNWRKVETFTPAALHLAKLILASKMPNYAPSTTNVIFEMLLRFSSWYKTGVSGYSERFGWDVLDANLGRAFLDHCMTTGDAGNDFSRLRVFYRYGAEVIRYPHFSTAVLLSLETIRAPGNAKGVDARGGDPNKGELGPDEVKTILNAIGRCAGREKDRILVWLCLELGRNSLQYTLIRNHDLTRVEDPVTGERLYQISIRQTKKRTAVDGKRAWPVSSALGDTLWATRGGAPDDPLLWWLDPERPQSDLGERLKRFAADADLRSQRTGRGHLILNPRRFRVTMLTRAADAGATAEKLAELADHSDLQNIMGYLDNSPSYVVRLGDRIDAYYDPALKRFQGKIISPDEVEGPTIPGFSAHLPLLDVGGIGKCGAKRICGLTPPITCYLCEKFLAYRNGPHREVVAAMEESMERMGPRIGLQLASPLAAARELVRQIEEERTGINHIEDGDSEWV